MLENGWVWCVQYTIRRDVLPAKNMKYFKKLTENLVCFCDNSSFSFLVTFTFNIAGYFFILIQINIRVSGIRCRFFCLVVIVVNFLKKWQCTSLLQLMAELKSTAYIWISKSQFTQDHMAFLSVQFNFKYIYGFVQIKNTLFKHSIFTLGLSI